jgi:uncharacterized membrane protein
MRKGYAFVIFFALFIGVSRTWFHRTYTTKNIDETPLEIFLLQVVILFLIFLIPGLLLARWYYKMKDKEIKELKRRYRD